MHGQVVNCNKAEIEKAIEIQAKEMHLKTSDELYKFLLGTIIRYDSSTEIYLLFAMCALHEYYEFHSVKFEQMHRDAVTD